MTFTPMQPWERIRGEKSDLLSNKKIALCITGSIAAVETVKLARELLRHGADVYPYMTRNALKFVGEDALLFSTGHHPITELSGLDEHLYDFDSILVAPATADIISKTSCGISDDAVSTLLLANLKRNTIFVPSMSQSMYENPILQANMEKLRKYVTFIEPKFEEDKAKMPDVDRIVAEVIHSLHNELRGKRVMVIGGAGYEKFDNFRIITNLATGRMGIEIARYAYYYGADVTLLLGLHSAQVPSYLKLRRFGTVSDLMNRVEEMTNYDAIVVPAALPDFKPERREGKIKSLEEFSRVDFEENPKLLRELRKRFEGFLVGFKAESGISREELIKRARQRMKEYSLDMIVANLLEDVKEDRTKAIVIFSDEDMEEFEGPKERLANRIVELMAESI